MERRKIVAVAYPVGRVGSSAMMGILHLAGLYVGSDRRLFEPAAMNPKGFFELPEQERFLRETWSVIYPHVSIPPADRMVDRIAAERTPVYRRLLDDSFGGRYPAAVKSQWCLTLPFLREMTDEFDVRVLYMERIREDQIASLLRVWRGAEDPVRRHASRDFVAEYIDRWRAFGEGILRSGGLPHMRVSFDALVADPAAVMSEIVSFLDIDAPPEDRIREWVDPSIVNRETLTLPGAGPAGGEVPGAKSPGPTLSLVVNTRNAAVHLEGCLASAAPVADEIVVVDMESGDGTADIARRYTDKVFSHPPVGYVEPARNFALDRATGDWVFVLDADERLSPELAESVRRVIAEDEGTALFLVPRRNHFAGRPLEGSGFGPDREAQPRLFRRGRVRWTDRIHGTPEIDGEVRLLPLPPEAHIRHRWAERISDFTGRLDRYTDFEAAALHEAGERWSLGRMLGAARLEIEDRYEPEKDGVRSLFLAGAMAYYRFLSWAKLWEKDGRPEFPLPPDVAALFRAFERVLERDPESEIAIENLRVLVETTGNGSE
ncbi:MAG: glycosyltransferase [Candidatus Eisenbacteria bacterium]